MIDIGLSKMALIGAVALIVIGPEKLPRVARTVGTLLGKAQRYVADVKSEVNRSMELDELKKMKDTVENAARDVEQSIQTSASEFEKDWAQATGTASGELQDTAVVPAYRHPWQELAPQARRHAPVVQGAQRRAHQGPVGRGARCALPAPEIPLMLRLAPSAALGALLTPAKLQHVRNPPPKKTNWPAPSSRLCSTSWSCATAWSRP
jgi:sec-independent protein translocase protein TatB